MYVFGGWNGVHCMNDMYSLDLPTKTWTAHPPTNPPSPRCSHGASVVEDGADAFMYVFGGYAIDKATTHHDKGYLNDLHIYRFSDGTWSTAPTAGGVVPCPRSRFRIAAHSGALYLFAGWNSQTHFGNLYKYDTVAGRWAEITTNFDQDGIGQFSMLVHDDVMYVFSGFTPKVGTRSSLFAYPLNFHTYQAR